MKNINCLILDDEPLAVEVIRTYIKDIPGLTCVATGTSAIEGLNLLESHPIDLLFLDINMPKLSGLNLLKTLKNPPLTIFTTAYPEYALEGYELDVVDYLLKPISFERFLKSVAKTREKFLLLPTEGSPISLKVDKKVYRILPTEITHVEGWGDYVKVHVNAASKPLVVKDSMKGMLQLLPGAFIRTHKSFLVNTQFIDHQEGNELVLAAGQRLPIGYSYKKGVGDFMLGR